MQCMVRMFTKGTLFNKPAFEDDWSVPIKKCVLYKQPRSRENDSVIPGVCFKRSAAQQRGVCGIISRDLVSCVVDAKHFTGGPHLLIRPSLRSRRMGQTAGGQPRKTEDPFHPTPRQTWKAPPFFFFFCVEDRLEAVPPMGVRQHCG